MDGGGCFLFRSLGAGGAAGMDIEELLEVETFENGAKLNVAFGIGGGGGGAATFCCETPRTESVSPTKRDVFR